MQSIQLILFSVVLFLTATINSVGQSTRTLSLDEAIELSLQNSKQLKYNQAKIEEAHAVLKQSRVSMLPDVSASGSYLRMHNPNVNLKLENPQTKGQVSSLSNIKINQVAYAMGTASLPIFGGFGLRYGIQSSKYLLEAAKLDSTNDREGLIQNAISAYSNLYKARIQIDLLNQNLKEAQQNVTNSVNLEKNGEIVRNDLLKVQLQQSNIELSILEAQKDLRMSIVNMNLMLGLPEDTELLPDTNWLQYSEDPRTIADWEQAAFDNRKDIKALQLREKSAAVNIKSIRSAYYPGIALTGNYVTAYIPNFLTITNGLGVGLGVKYNLSSLWKTESKVAQARAKQLQIHMNGTMLTDQVRIQINDAYQDYIVSLRKVDVYAKTVTQATENYTINQSKFSNKTATTTDLLNAELGQVQAKLNFVFAKADVVVAYKKLLQTAGLLNNQISISK